MRQATSTISMFYVDLGMFRVPLSLGITAYPVVFWYAQYGMTCFILYN